MSRSSAVSPEGGGHKIVGCAVGSPKKDRRNGVGYAYLGTAPDDHSRLAYTEDLPDETFPTCSAFPARATTRATTWFTARGTTIERVLTTSAWRAQIAAVSQICVHGIIVGASATTLLGEARWVTAASAVPTTTATADSAVHTFMVCPRAASAQRQPHDPAGRERRNRVEGLEDATQPMAYP